MKNIIMLVTDTYRYDNLGARAVRPVRTPCLDRFAAERATSIEGYHIGSFPTIPNRTDLATSRVGWPHYGWQPLDQSSKNHIAKLLGGAGYATQLICDTPHLFPARFNGAFHGAFTHRGQEGDKPLLHLNDPIRPVMPHDKTRMHPLYRGEPLANLHRWINHYPEFETQTFAAQTAETTVRWLEQNFRGGPFFLWVDFFDPHEPWDPPEYLVRRYDPDYAGPPMIHPNYGPASVYTPAELKNLWAHYAAEAELTDRWLGRVLQKIDDLQLWDDTVVAVFSDHGFSIGEHDRCGKSNICDSDPRFWPIYPEVSHVPLLLAGAGIPSGKSLDLLAQPVDMLPTLSELAGVSLTPPEPFQGKSFAGPLRAGQGRHRDFVVSAAHVPTRGAVPRRATTPFLRTDRWGFAPAGATGRPELYDLAHDPLATRDLAAQHPDQVAELNGLLVSYLREHGADEGLIALWGTPVREAGTGSWAIDYADPKV